MDKQSDLLEEDFSEYFDLFQKQTEYSNKILENAKKIKQSIQELYKNINLPMQEIDNDVWVFDFDVILTQVSEQLEPDALKLFTRQYSPIVKVYKNDSSLNLISTIAFYDETKCIHKHINELFVGESVSQEYFFDVAQQFFLLDFVYKQLNNGTFTDSFIDHIKKNCTSYTKTTNNIICINCKLRGRKLIDNINPNLHSAISHINTLWHSITSQTMFCIISNYKNYLTESEFIKLLNDNNSRLIPETIYNYFQNDFLLLNNMEFINNDKPYTIEWQDRIITPLLLEKKDDTYCLKDIEEIKKNKDQIFLFQKITPDGIFYKTEICIPDKEMTHENFNMIVSLSMQLLRLKQHEEKLVR